MARGGRAALFLGLLSCLVGVVVLLYALLLGFNIEATPRAIADSAKGHRIAVPGVVALVAGVVATVAFRRRWAVVVAVVAAAAAVVAILMAVLIPSG